MRFFRPLACKQWQRHLFLYLINKTETAELLSLRSNKKFLVNMHCSLYCCIHSLCKPQSPIHCNGILHGKIYIVMILPKTTCCKPFHSFLHIENITHSSNKIIASLICKNLRNGMSCQYIVNLYAKYQSMHWHRSGSVSHYSDSIKNRKSCSIDKTRIQRSVNGKTTAMQLYISSKEPVQPKYQIKFGVGTVHRVCWGLRTEVLF